VEWYVGRGREIGVRDGALMRHERGDFEVTEPLNCGKVLRLFTFSIPFVIGPCYTLT
jgi:hypothetical protein